MLFMHFRQPSYGNGYYVGKEEYNASNTTRSFEKTFDAYVQKNPSKWDLGNNIPKLGDIRGKIRLLRRFLQIQSLKG